MTKSFVLGIFISLLLLCLPIFSNPIPLEREGDPNLEPHRQAALRTYQTLSSMTPSIRRAHYVRLSPEMKGDLWALQLRSHLNDPGLSAEQRRFLGEMLLRVPRIFAGYEGEEELGALEAQARATFGEASGELFFELAGSSSQVAATVRHAPEIAATDTDPIAPPFDCDCSIRDNGCPNHHPCNAVGCLRDASWPSCGFLWMYSCDGMCQAG